MTEDESRHWLTIKLGDTAVDRLTRFVDILLVESERQNLISKSTVSSIWARHIVDSAQLLLMTPTGWTCWTDIGSGAGLPGLVIAILSSDVGQMRLIEPRRLRTEFLRECATTLELTNVEVVLAKADQIGPPISDVISARAVASLGDLLTMSKRFADENTQYLLPKGERAQSEVAATRGSWHGTFHVERSLVDPTSGIVVATGIKPR